VARPKGTPNSRREYLPQLQIECRHLIVYPRHSGSPALSSDLCSAPSTAACHARSACGLAGNTRSSLVWLVVAPAAQNFGSRMFIKIFVGPLPPVSDHIHHGKRTRSGWMRLHAIGSAHGAPFVRRRNCRRISSRCPMHIAAHRFFARHIATPLVWQSLASPRRVRARIFQRNRRGLSAAPSGFVPFCQSL
jgi:hypothetical protein